MHEGTVKATFSEQEFCSAVGISRVTAWRLRLAGKIAYCRVGNKVRYLPRHIDEYLLRCEKQLGHSRSVHVKARDGR
jgi:Helix-turn-helix domain